MKIVNGTGIVTNKASGNIKFLKTVSKATFAEIGSLLHFMR